ncbi:MAG: ATP-binding protein [Actinomycetia bacterium]|nr:ATP-binding protein [Actinomycetes bacterium]
MAEERLIDFVEQVSGGTRLRVEESLGDGFVRLRTEEAERRQAKHDIRHVEDAVCEMLRNARDAHAERIYIATSREGDRRCLVAIDDGDGIPKALQELVFDARVTSKLETMVEDEWGIHGRGMALFSIKSNVQRAWVVSSAPNLGSAIRLDIDTSHLAERSDQSSFPELKRNAEGRLEVATGPKNITRTALEFALIHKDRLQVFLGSSSEIASTLCAHAQRNVSSDVLLFCDDPESVPVVWRLALANDAAELMMIAASIGLDLSERTAHRILSGQIAPVSDLVSRAQATSRRSGGGVNIFRDSRGLKLAPEDIEAFSREMEKAFEGLAERYYLSLTDLPRVQVKGDMITVRFPIEKE